MKDLKNKTVLITGGARGMGRLWAEHFISDGAHVILWDIDLKELNNTKRELEEKHQTDILVQKTDISDISEVRRCATEALEIYGAIDVLVNNAGIVTGCEFLKTPEEQHSKIIDINLKSMFYTMKAFLPGMIKKGEGHIVNVSSASGFLGVPYMPAYTAAKWAVIGLTESIMLEMKVLGHKNIHFTLLCPSYVKTTMFQGVHAPLFSSLLDPEKFINLAYRKFKRGRYIIIEPWLAKLTPVLRGILPNKAFNFIAKILGATSSMRDWKGRGEQNAGHS
jgi:short-subunit dehydrogenase